MTEFKWAEDDSRNSPHFHDINNCGRPVRILNKRKVKGKFIGKARCYVHRIIVCTCGWEHQFHYGTYNRALPPLQESDENSPFRDC